MDEPIPEAGWSRETIVIDGAIAVPPAAAHGGFGVLGPMGDCPQAATWREGARLTPPAVGGAEVHEVLEGCHLWGGVFFGHFGHFMVETVARLWAARQQQVDSILFVPRHDLLKDFQRYQARMINLLGIDVPVRILRRPTRVARLIVPGQGFGLGKIASGTPEFRAMMRDMASRIEPHGPEKIYISRTRFGGTGGVLAEEVIERNLLAAGYSPIYPERMSLDEQFSAYKATQVVVGLDSSAFHIFGFVSDSDKKAAIILRRSHRAFRHITRQLSHFMEKEPAVVHALAADWMPAQRKMANHQSWGEIDHFSLREQLIEQGLISRNLDWIAPTAEDIDASRELAEMRAKCALVRRPAVLNLQEL